MHLKLLPMKKSDPNQIFCKKNLVHGALNALCCKIKNNTTCVLPLILIAFTDVHYMLVKAL